MKMKFLQIALLLFLAVFSHTSAVAEEDAVSKYRNYLPEQIAAMSDEERSSSVPMMYSMAASNGLSDGANLLFGNSA